MRKYLIGVLIAVLIAVGLVALTSHFSASATEGDEECVPKDAWTETTDWLKDPPNPETEFWEIVDTRTVVDREEKVEYSPWIKYRLDGDWVLIEERTQTIVISEGYWQRYSYNGRWDSNTEAPVFPGPNWQKNVKGDPHDIGVEGPYFRSHGNHGKGDWFYLDYVDGETHTYKEYKFSRTTPAITHEEYKFSFTHEAVTCEEPETPVCGDEDYVPVGDECEEEEPPVDNECKGRPVVGGPCAPVDEPKTPEVEVETSCTATKCVKTTTDAQGNQIGEPVVIEYGDDVVEEGL